MAISVIKGNVFTRRRLTAAATAIAGAGLPLKVNGRYAVVVADGDIEIGVDEFLGVSQGTSTDTASVEGFVDYIEYVPGMVLRGPATTPANVSESIIGNKVTFDVAAGVFTIDENATDATSLNALVIVAVDTVTGTVDVEVREAATLRSS